jgi:hypothetical protein
VERSALSLEGWERRFVADPARAREAAEVYAAAGFEVHAVPARPEDLAGDRLRDGCETCWLAQSFGFQVIYTRRPKAAPVPRGGGDT